MAFQKLRISSNRLVPEVTRGTTPAAAAYRLNVETGQPKRTRTRVRPNVLTGDRHSYPTRVVYEEGELPARAPFQFYNALPFYESLMCRTLPSAISVTGTDISFDTSDAQILRVANGLTVFPVRYLLVVRGAAVAANNGIKGPILVSATGALTVPAGQVVDEAAGASVTLSIIPLLDGTTDKYFSWQWHATTLDHRRAMTGCRVDSLNLDLSLKQLMMEDWKIMGNAPADVGSDIGSGNVAGWPRTSDFEASALDLSTLYVGNVNLGAIDLKIADLKLSIKNNLEAADTLTDSGPSDHIPDIVEAEVTGSILADANALLFADAVDLEESFFFVMGFEDPAGNIAACCIPAARIDGDLGAGGAADIVKFMDMKINSHDPSKDAAADLYLAAAASYEVGWFFSPAP